MTAPAGEIGAISVLPSWGALAGADPADPPAFQFPQRVQTVERMRTDPQIDALCSSLTMPIMRYRWELDPNGARDEVVQQVSTDFGIPILGSNDPAPRSRRRFKHRDHLEHALLALWHGFMMFEQVPDTERYDLVRDGWRLRKLAPRMPSTIDRIHVASDGGLAGITQYGYRPPVRAGRAWITDPEPQIGVNSLLAYVWKREGANWYGRSMLRPLYRDWILKDRALRVDAIKNERFGVGIPTATAPEGGDPAQYSKLAQSIRASETSGVGLPAGASVGVEGIRGTLPDVMASVRYYDESMARAFMAMVIQLGQTQTGSRALGNTFADHFQMLVEAVADWYKDTTNEHAIEDYVDWNWDEEEQAPLLRWSYAEHSPLAVTDLVSMVTAGVITMDTATEAAVRKQTQLPELSGERPAPVAPPAPVAAGSRLPFARSRKRGRGSGVEARKQTLQDRALGHRDPNEIELAAKTDFETLQTQWADATSYTVEAWKTEIKAGQVEALAEQVFNAVTMGDARALAQLAAPVQGVQLLEDLMLETAEDALVLAKAEAAAQGATIPTINTAVDLVPSVAARAEQTATLLSRGLSDAAARLAVQLGVNVGPQDAADAIAAHLHGLSDSYLDDMIGGAMTQAQNQGRRVVMDTQDNPTVYSSELLDQNTCTNCASVDGKQYTDLLAADADYPTGGYKECLGGPRCRGTLVAVYAEGEA